MKSPRNLPSSVSSFYTNPVYPLVCFVQFFFPAGVYYQLCMCTVSTFFLHEMIYPTTRPTPWQRAYGVVYIVRALHSDRIRRDVQQHG